MVSVLLRTEPIRRIYSAEAIAEEIMGGLASGRDIRRDLPFREGALEEDHCLLLDEMNLATEVLLQCMEACIADQRINVRMPRKWLNRHQKYPSFPSRFTPTGFPEAAKEKYLNITERLATYLGSGKDGKASPGRMSVHHGRCDEEEAEHSNDCFAIRDIPTLFDAIQKFKDRFDGMLTFHGMGYRGEIDATFVLLLRRKSKFFCCLPGRFARRSGFHDCFRHAALMGTVRHRIFAN
jgi:hypothetical protein